MADDAHNGAGGVAPIRVARSGALARAALLWGLIGLALGTFSLSCLPEISWFDLVTANRLPDWGRPAGLLAALGGVTLAILAALGLGWRSWRRAGDIDRAIEAVETWGLRLRPALVAPALPALLSTAVWGSAPVRSSLLAVGVAAMIALWARSLPSPGPIWTPRPWVIGVALVGMGVAYAVYITWFHVLHHEAMGTRAFDLGIMENVVWNTAHGRWFETSIEGRNHLEVHASFILAAIVPVYMLAPRTDTLLAVQAALLAAAAAPLFLLARERLKSDALGLAVAAAWLAHPAVGTANFYDFHELAFAPVLFFSAVWCLETRRPLGLALSVALLLTVKEDLSIVVALLGLYALLGGRWRSGLALATTGALSYVLLTRYVVERSFTGYFEAMIPEGAGPSALLTTLLVNPLYSLGLATSDEKVLFALQIFSPVAFLCFARLRGLVLLAYGLAMAFLADRPPLYTLGFQYALQLVPAAFVGALDTLGEMERSRRRPWLVFALLLGLIHGYQYGVYYPRQAVHGGFEPVRFAWTAEDQERREALLKLRALVPASASLTASEEVVPHFARRRRIYSARFATSARRGSTSDYLLLSRDDPMPTAMAGAYSLRTVNRYFRLYVRSS